MHIFFIVALKLERDFHVHCHEQIWQECCGEGIYTRNPSSNVLLFGVSGSEKLMNFMHFHNSHTRNRDHHILLIMTGNTHKESCHKLSLCLLGKRN